VRLAHEQFLQPAVPDLFTRISLKRNSLGGGSQPRLSDFSPSVQPKRQGVAGLASASLISNTSAFAQQVGVARGRRCRQFRFRIIADVLRRRRSETMTLFLIIVAHTASVFCWALNSAGGEAKSAAPIADANRSLSHANRSLWPGLHRAPGNGFRTSETKGPNPLPDGLRFPQRPRTGHYTRPKPRKIEGVPRRRGTRG
jgi:hypothetical protein